VRPGLDECIYGSWPTGHPIMATIGGLFGLTFMGMNVQRLTPAVRGRYGVGSGGCSVSVRSPDLESPAAALARGPSGNTPRLTAQAAGGPTIRRQPFHS